MKRFFVIAGVAVLLVLASIMPVSAGRGNGREVPIKGTVSGEHWVVGEVEPGEVWQFFSTGEGKMSHLGRVHYSLEQTSSFDANFTVISSGTITFTAANHDKLVIAQHVESQIVGAGDGFTIGGTWSVADGTGRFANATGTGTMEAIGDIPSGNTVFGLDEGTARFNFNGGIAYNRSNRSK